MPTVYAAGNPESNGYLSGIAVNTRSELITQIRDILTQAGQNVDSTDIANNRITAEGDDNGDKCHTIWEVVNIDNNQSKLIITGDFAGDGTSLSTPKEIPFFENLNSSLYLSVDESGGIVSVINSGLESSGIHFGFPERTHDNPGSWYVGLMDQWLDSCQIAEDPNGNRWLEMHSYINSAAELKTGPGAGGYHLLWDAMVICLATSSTYNSATATNASTIVAHEPWRGCADAVSGEPILSSYGYLVGKLPQNSYSIPANDTPDQRAIAMHNPGPVRFARTGMASYPAGEQRNIGTTGGIIMSAGGAGVCQGMIIKAPTS